MKKIYEARRENFLISTNPAHIDLNSIYDFLERAYWAQGRARERTERAMQNSLVFGMYDDKQQIGIARVVSDFAVFAYLCDVFIHEDYRAHGLGKWLIQTVMAHPDLQGLRRWTLATRDAHGFYQQFGWAALDNPAGWMEILRPFASEQRD